MTIRRDVLALGAASLAPAWLFAQGARRPLKLAWFTGSAEKEDQAYVEAFRQGMKERGYTEGRDFSIDYYRRSDTIKPFNWLARDIVGDKPDVILATCEVTAEAAQKATTSIPIVLTAATDPVANRLVASLGRPGGNITGISSTLVEVSLKRLELLKEIVPKADRVAMLRWRWEVVSPQEIQAVEAAARNLGMAVIHYQPEDEGDFKRAFADMQKTRVSGMIDLAGLAVAFPYMGAIAEFALQYRVPSVFFLREIVERGGLVSFGPNVADGFRRSAHYVDRLARGAKAADLPIEQPSVFETCVNLKTARALGIRFPESILLRASRVIE